MTGSCEKITYQHRLKPVPPRKQRWHRLQPVQILDFFTASRHRCPRAAEIMWTIRDLGGLGQRSLSPWFFQKRFWFKQHY